MMEKICKFISFYCLLDSRNINYVETFLIFSFVEFSGWIQHLATSVFGRDMNEVSLVSDTGRNSVMRFS